MVYAPPTLLQEIRQVAHVVGVEMGYGNVGLAPGHLGTFQHFIEVCAAGKLRVPQVDEQRLLAAFEQQVAVDTVGEVEVLHIEHRMQEAR